MTKINDPAKVAIWASSPFILEQALTNTGCEACDLGFQPETNGCCVMRGSYSSEKMIVGEAPGKEEDSRRSPFTGPAGRLLDKIWASVGMETDHWYLTNVVLCRPYSPKGSGKENFTPKAEQRKKCRPYLDRQIELVQPKIIVTLGAVATAALVGARSVRMGDYRGRLLRDTARGMDSNCARGCLYTGRPLLFPMLHPAAILHASREPKKQQDYKLKTWTDVQRLKQIIEEENIQ